MSLVILAVFLFLAFLGVTLLAVGAAFRVSERARKRQLRGILLVLTENIEARQIKILLKSADSGVEAVRRFLNALNVTGRLESLLQQSGLGWSVERLLASMLVAGVTGGILGFIFPVVLNTPLSVIAFACTCAYLPFWHVTRKRNKRIAQFEVQFPEALDFLARALRAGHALGPALGILGKESPEPLKGEFGRVFYEQNLGESLPTVLNHLGERIPLVDVRFFVSAVLMQRETGGNLGEILSRLAHVIRERFRIKGQVRAASAHGRITAGILTVMPIITAIGFNAIAHDYFKLLFQDKLGRWLLWFAAGDMILGYFIMKRIVNIKV